MTGLSALETAVVPFHLAEPAEVVQRLQNAHVLIIQVLLLAGAEMGVAGQDGSSAWDKAERGGDDVARALLAEWDRGGANCECFSRPCLP